MSIIAIDKLESVVWSAATAREWQSTSRRLPSVALAGALGSRGIHPGMGANLRVWEALQRYLDGEPASEPAVQP